MENLKINLSEVINNSNKVNNKFKSINTMENTIKEILVINTVEDETKNEISFLDMQTKLNEYKNDLVLNITGKVLIYNKLGKLIDLYNTVLIDKKNKEIKENFATELNVKFSEVSKMYQIRNLTTDEINLLKTLSNSLKYVAAKRKNSELTVEDFLSQKSIIVPIVNVDGENNEGSEDGEGSEGEKKSLLEVMEANFLLLTNKEKKEFITFANNNK